MKSQERKIRIALPSKGLLADGSMELLSNVGFPIYKPNPRQYIASIPQLPGIEVIFQRPGDIVIGVRDGSVDFGITGSDIYLEKKGTNGSILPLNNHLGYGKCTLNVIVPDSWERVNSLDDLKEYQVSLGRPLKVATKFPNLAGDFFNNSTSIPIELIKAEGTLEIAPTVGYADLIVDLVSTGTTLRDNRLKKLSDGTVLNAEACLISNKKRLRDDSSTLTMATQLLEMIGAYLRGKQNLAVFANIRADSMEDISEKIFKKSVISGLQGPTVSRILTSNNENFFAIHVVVHKESLQTAIQEIRDIGGSGVVVSPVNYIFEEEPLEIKKMLSALEEK
jgi:ATP phosphoribosyltransferase